MSLYVHFACQIESALPTLARPIMSLDANEDAILGALKLSLVNFFSFSCQKLLESYDSIILVTMFYIFITWLYPVNHDASFLHHSLHANLFFFFFF